MLPGFYVSRLDKSTSNPGKVLTRCLHVYLRSLVDKSQAASDQSQGHCSRVVPVALKTNTELNHCSPGRSLVRYCATTLRRLASVYKDLPKALLPDFDFNFQNHPPTTPPHPQFSTSSSNQQNTFSPQVPTIFVFTMPRNRKKPVYNPKGTLEALAPRVTPASHEHPKRGDPRILDQIYPCKQSIPILAQMSTSVS